MRTRLVIGAMVAAGFVSAAAAQDHPHPAGGRPARTAPAAGPRPGAPAQPRFAPPVGPRAVGVPGRPGGGPRPLGAPAFAPRYGWSGGPRSPAFGGPGQGAPAVNGAQGGPPRFAPGPQNRFAPGAPQGFVGRPEGAPPTGGGYRGPGAGAGYAGRHDSREPDRFGGRVAWNHDWRRDARFNPYALRRARPELFALPVYVAPVGLGYGYRRFAVGYGLDTAFFAEDYWIGDPWDYGLPPAEGDLRWVRYYGDALLIDLDTGQVVDAVYGLFG